jgi:4a-hydroxytetrahydrobiopterin dehydratase
MTTGAATTEELRLCKIGGCCGKDTPLLADADVHSRMGALPLWQLSADGKLISREFTAKNWQSAMAFLNSLSELAEEEGHHPDIHLTGWRNVRVELTTHAIGGLSMPDLVLAAKLDAIPVTFSPKWLKESPAGALITQMATKEA